MPAQSNFSADEKAKIKSHLPEGTNKILTVARARVYYAYPDPNAWSYTGMQGALAFVRDNARKALCLKMVDLGGTRGIMWEHEFYDGIEYFQDRPFFHSFAGDVSTPRLARDRMNLYYPQECMIGLVFSDESEAKNLYKRVNTKLKKSGGM
jgi:neural Wiskott-Aldrich syndrome protein